MACLLEVGAGGAYYLATAADVIVAHPTTITGGVGVVINLYNLRETMAALNILDQSVKSGENIDMGTTLRAHSKEATKLLKDMADEFHEGFKAVVRQTRPRLAGQGMEVFDGRIMSGKAALERGLVDRLGDLDDALAIARQLGKCDAPGVLLYRHPDDRAWSPYEVPTTLPFTGHLVPASIPGLDRQQTPRQQMPLFLYMWLPDPA